MKRKISCDDFANFINSNFKSKLDFSKQLQISYSHLDSLLKDKVTLGNKVYERLEILCKNKNANIDELLEALPLKNIKEIIVTKNDEIIASITSKDIIFKDGYEVVCVPYE